MNLEVKSKIVDLLERNEIPFTSFLDETYKCLLVSIFEVIVHEMDVLEYKKQVKERLRNSVNKLLTVKHIVYEKTKCDIDLEEAETLYQYLYAYFTKKNIREIYDDHYKNKILFAQNHKCKICKREITLENSELDHVIPWSLVGDELGEENFQMLCRDCNRRKSKNIAYNLKMFLINQ